MYGKATGRHSSGAAGVCVPTVADAYKHQTVGHVQGVTLELGTVNCKYLLYPLHTQWRRARSYFKKPKTNSQLFRGESLQLPPSNEMVEIKIAKYIMNMNYATITVCCCCNFSKFFMPYLRFR